MEISLVIILAIIIAYFFDIMNGLHDCANSVATIVSTRVLTPRQAVVWAAFFNFIAFLFFGVAVASTIGKGLVISSAINPLVIISALSSAIIWNLITWHYGLPSSSSHALVGGLLGAAIANVGFDAVISSGLTKVLVAIIISPFVGFLLSMLLVSLVKFTFKSSNPFKSDKFFRYLQLVSASLYSLGHGGNDAQKTMGIISVLLFSQGLLGATFYVPLWVILSCHAAMAFGTLMGGWKIIKTMGSKLTELKPYQGCCAETAGAMTLFGATALGVPISTTHTITGSIIGTARNVKLINWKVFLEILLAWILTIPATLLLSGLLYLILSI